MNINVNQQYNRQNISVVVDGWCNHNDSLFEDHEYYGFSNWEGHQVPDELLTKELLTCQRCGAWQDEDYCWREESFEDEAN